MLTLALLDDIAAWEAQHGAIPQGAVVAIRRADSHDALATNDLSTAPFPIARDAALFLVDARYTIGFAFCRDACEFDFRPRSGAATRAPWQLCGRRSGALHLAACDRLAHHRRPGKDDNNETWRSAGPHSGHGALVGFSAPLSPESSTPAEKY